jgi:hypothetical protein
MKQFAIAALLGVTSAVQLSSEYRPNPAQSPWAATTKPGTTNAITGAYQPKDKFVTLYERVMPSQFTEESDDRLMNSLIGTYSVEGKTNGAPNGKFYLTKKGALQVAGEVCETHFGFKGEKKQKWLDSHFNHAFNHVDTLKEGFIPVAKGPVFLRNLVDSVEIGNKLQLQLEEEGAITNENEYRPLNAVVAPWSAKPAAAATGTLTGAYTAGQNYGADRTYERAMPAQFTEEKDDRLMNSLISKYALEAKVDGAPSGKFYLNKDGMRAVSSEVVGTHFGFKGKKREKYLNEKFPTLWSQADVNKDGYLAVQKGPVFLRNLLDSVELSNGLQLQIAEDN